MYRIAIAVALVLTFAAAVAWTQSSSRGFYSREQARRGEQAYAQNCASCHKGDLTGGVKDAPPLKGETFLRRWYTVGDLFSMTSMAQPADNRHGLSTDTYLDVVAYLLEANGLPAGNELKPNVPAMKNMVINPRNAPKAAATSGDAEGYYTEEQASRGKGYFEATCNMCHTADKNGPSGSVDISLGRGYLMADRRSLGSMANEEFLSRWPNVADLYNKNRTTQPAYDARGLSTQEYLDITAYIMRVNGLPAGKQELKDDLNAMRNMTLEKGFTRLFNGRDLSGWGFVLGPNCKPRPEGCAQTVPGTTYRVEDGMIFSTGRPHGYMYTQNKYKDFDLRLEYRYKPYPGMESDSDFYGNSGILLFITEHQVWPRMLEVQLKAKDEGRMFGISAKVVSTPVDELVRKQAKNPTGQWNAIRLVSQGGQIKCYLNGILLSTVTEYEFKEPGHIAFESESGEIYFRNVRIKEEGAQTKTF